jgi:hypothetical protein
MTRPLHRSAEIALAGAALVGLGFLILTPHVQHGGFYADDWANAAAFHFEGWWRMSLYEWRHTIPARPILALLHPLPYALFGLDPTYHLAAAVVLAALTSLSFFAFLRVLGIEFPHALAMALLTLVFPWAGAAHLWPTGAMNNVAVITYFLGSIAALRGLALGHARRRGAIMLHLFAAALYLVSILTYEVAAAAILLSGLLYRTRVSWRALRARWALDALIVLVPLAISLRATSRVRHVGSLNERVRDLPHFVGQGLSLFASIFVPRDLSSSWASPQSQRSLRLPWLDLERLQKPSCGAGCIEVRGAQAQWRRVTSCFSGVVSCLSSTRDSTIGSKRSRRSGLSWRRIRFSPSPLSS